MADVKLKPCPFCGTTPRLEHSEIEKCRSRENGDLITRWTVRCANCGCKQDGGVTEYIFMSNETLHIKDEHLDGRRRAIEAWNRRANNG